MTLSAVDRPAVLIDIDRVDANIDRTQARADRHGIRRRPHIKTHKLPMLAARQVARGAVGIPARSRVRRRWAALPLHQLASTSPRLTFMANGTTPSHHESCTPDAVASAQALSAAGLTVLNSPVLESDFDSFRKPFS
jgi:hypothetical protein